MEDAVSEILLSDTGAKVLPFIAAMSGFFAADGETLQFSLLTGALLLIVVVSGQFVVKLGREFLDKVDQHV
jgi:hypothetical protein